MWSGSTTWHHFSQSQQHETTLLWYRSDSLKMSMGKHTCAREETAREDSCRNTTWFWHKVTYIAATIFLTADQSDPYSIKFNHQTSWLWISFTSLHALHLLITLSTLHTLSVHAVPDDILSMRIKYPQTEPTAHQPLHLQCCASHTSQGISSQPALQWYKDGRLLTGTKTSSVGERERCLTIEFTSLQDRDEGEYTCRATLQSSRMEELLVKEESFELSLEWLFTTTDGKYWWYLPL